MVLGRRFLGRRTRRAKFQAQVETNFRFLRDSGYTAARYQARSDAILGEMFSATFRSTSREVVIEVANPRRAPPLINVYIYREPRTSVEDDLELMSFLKSRFPDVARAIAQVENTSASFEEFLAAVIPCYANALATHTAKIMNGQDWETGFYVQWT